MIGLGYKQQQILDFLTDGPATVAEITGLHRGSYRRKGLTYPDGFERQETVRRLHKLAEIGLVEKGEDKRWRLSNIGPNKENGED